MPPWPTPTIAQQSTLETISGFHARRIRMVRMVLPFVTLVAIAGWIAWGQFDRLRVIQRFFDYIQEELGSLDAGKIESVIYDEFGNATTRRIDFEQMLGTGLSGAPLDLGKLTFTVERPSGNAYQLTAQNAIMDPIAGRLRIPGDLHLSGPSGLEVITSDGEIDLLTFETRSFGDVVLFAAGGLAMTATNGLRFAPNSADVALFGESSARVPRRLPNFTD